MTTSSVLWDPRSPGLAHSLVSARSLLLLARSSCSNDAVISAQQMFRIALLVSPLRHGEPGPLLSRWSTRIRAHE